MGATKEAKDSLSVRLIHAAIMIALVLIPLIFSMPIFRLVMLIGGLLAFIELMAAAVQNDKVLSTPAILAVVAEGTIVLCGTAVIVIAIPGRYDAFAILLTACLADSFAYFAGKLWGKRHPFPTISPGKTAEGYIGGYLATAVIMVTYFVFFYNDGVFHLGDCVMVSLGPMVAFVGDLLESGVKRILWIKDSNEAVREVPALKQLESITRGHGGFLDRLDSISAVAVLYGICLYLNY